MLDRDIAQNLAEELKIDLFTIYREYLQLLFLKYFYNQKETDKIFFKGGTALRFLFGSFRFSEDLDFTSLIIGEKIRKIVPNTLKDFKKEIEEINFKEEKGPANSFSGRIIQKLEELRIPVSVRLDFSFREKPFYTDISSIETIFPISPYPQVAHFKIEEILAEKIRAILTRLRGRDIFDLWFILSKKILIDWELVNKKMALYKKKTNRKELIRVIKDFSQEEIKSDLTRFLPLSHRKLVKEIKELTLDKLKLENEN